MAAYFTTKYAAILLDPEMMNNRFTHIRIGIEQLSE